MDQSEPNPLLPSTPPKKSVWHKPINFVYAAFMLTLIAGGLTMFIIHKTSEVVSSPTEEVHHHVNVQPLTGFRVPTPDTAPHIAGATIERITIPNCHDCYSDILMSADGISDTTLIKINNDLTNHFFVKYDNDYHSDNPEPDIRDPKNRLYSSLEPEMEFHSSIVYYDSKNHILNFKTDFWNGQDAQNLDQGSYLSLLITSTGTNYLDIEVSNDVLDIDAVLNYFYSSLKPGPTDTNECNSYYLEKGLDFNTQEVILTGKPGSFCDEFLAAIPFADILREVPQYVPQDSVLWKLK